MSIFKVDEIIVTDGFHEPTQIIKKQGNNTGYFGISVKYHRIASHIINEPISLTIADGGEPQHLSLRLELSPEQIQTTKLLWYGQLPNVLGDHIHIEVKHNGIVIKEIDCTLID